MSDAHSELLDRTAAAVASLRQVFCRLFRNETGQGVTGRVVEIFKPTTVTLRRGDFLVRNGHRIKYGLLKGGGDLIGYATIEITPDMVGQRIAVFASAEGKVGKDKLRPEQRVWHDNVKAAGGISVEVRAPEDAIAAILSAAGKKAG